MFNECEKPKHSPWGAIQDAKQEMPGVWKVYTASHGGYILSAERFAAMPAACKINMYGGGKCFEEDCEWALVAVAFPEEFFAVNPSAKQYVEATLTGCYQPAADYWKGKQ